MPSRVIREGLLDSQRYWSVPVNAQQLLIHLMLLADDFGLVSLAPVFVSRRCFNKAPSQARIDKLIRQLHDADLLRVYEIEGARYGFIPRFRQTLRIEKAKYPAPPSALYEDDEHAKEKFLKNKDKFKKCSATAVQSVSRQHVEVESKGREKEVESKPGETPKRAGSEPVKSADDWAQELGLVQQPGEGRGHFHVRVLEAKTKLKSCDAAPTTQAARQASNSSSAPPACDEQEHSRPAEPLSARASDARQANGKEYQQDPIYARGCERLSRNDSTSAPGSFFGVLIRHHGWPLVSEAILDCDRNGLEGPKMRHYIKAYCRGRRRKDRRRHAVLE